MLAGDVQVIAQAGATGFGETNLSTGGSATVNVTLGNVIDLNPNGIALDGSDGFQYFLAPFFELSGGTADGRLFDPYSGGMERDQ